MDRTCQVMRLGLVDYLQAWEMQNRIAQEIANGERPQTLLLLEHPHTYTFGRRGHRENLLWNEDELEQRGIRVYWVDRGGDVTYHGPGQLVGYPLLRLAQGNIARPPSGDSLRLPQADYVGYIRNLEKVLILTLAQLGVLATPMPGLTGVWVQRKGEASGAQPPAKIAAIGVKVDAKGISRHGFALNVNPEMHYWQGIIGCGLKEYPVTSLAEWVRPLPSMAQVMDAVVSAFGWVFGLQMVEVERLSSAPFPSLV